MVNFHFFFLLQNNEDEKLSLPASIGETFCVETLPPTTLAAVRKSPHQSLNFSQVFDIQTFASSTAPFIGICGGNDTTRHNDPIVLLPSRPLPGGHGQQLKVSVKDSLEVKRALLLLWLSVLQRNSWYKSCVFFEQQNMVFPLFLSLRLCRLFWAQE